MIKNMRAVDLFFKNNSMDYEITDTDEFSKTVWITARRKI